MSPKLSIQSAMDLQNRTPLTPLRQVPRLIPIKLNRASEIRANEIINRANGILNRANGNRPSKGAVSKGTTAAIIVNRAGTRL